MKRSSMMWSCLLAAGILAGADAALSQPGGHGGGMMGGGPGYGMGPGMMGGDGFMGPRGMMGGCGMMMGAGGEASAFIDGRIAFLKAELAITDAQKGVWDAYAEATKNNLQSMQGMHQMMQAVFDAKTPVERLDAHIAIMESRIGTLKEVMPALGKLYEALSAEQKKKADELLTGMGCMM